MHTTDGGDVVAATAAEFDRLDGEGFRVLAVSLTRQTVRELNEAITARIVARGAVRALRPIEAFVPRDIQTAEKTVRDTYEPGTVLRVVRDDGALERGVQVTVVEVAADSVTAGCGELRRPIERLPLNE